MLTATPQRILVTGSAGRLGKAAAGALVSAGHFVRGFDRAPSPHATEAVVGDLASMADVLAAAAGMDAIIHMAATPDDDDFMSSLLPNNITGLYNVMEAARLHQIRRVALASSGQVNWHRHLQGPFPVRLSDPLTPRYWYAVTKVLAEQAGQIYAVTHGMDVLAIRLGACPRDRALLDYIGSTEITRDVYLSPGDAGRFFCAFMEAAPGFGFQVIYLTSKPVLREVLDMEPTRRLFGFEPQDRWPEGVPPEILGVG